MDTASTSLTNCDATTEIETINRWIFNTIRPYIKGRALEIDSGINSLCSLFINHNRPIHLSDTNKHNFQSLLANYKGNPIIRAIHSLDFSDSLFKEKHRDTLDAFDTVIALNLKVYEFYKMVDNIKYTLPQGGKLILILPAYTSLYYGLEQNLADWSRYNMKTIREITKFNFSIFKAKFFNLAEDATGAFVSKTGLSVLTIFQKN